MSLPQAQARQQIKTLIDKYRSLAESERKALSEANVVHQFVVPLLETLGWPTQDPARYRYELQTVAGRPDMTLIPASGGTIFVEAKRFGAISELAEARQTIAGIVTPGELALPGMATDRTLAEQQAINYAFQNGGQWAILTNFERLRLFNARRDWLVLSFERPGAYLDEFDLLWQLSYTQVCNGGLDGLSNQRYRVDVDTDYLNFINTWRERLAQDILARRRENPWVLHTDGTIDVSALRAVVQRLLDRLVIIRFAEDHLIIPPGTLAEIYELRKRNPYTFSLSQHYAQLFRRFDEQHNSALFAADLTDQAILSDEALGGLTTKLYEARYRALSADIMGNTYEQYLGKTLVQVGNTVLTRNNLETRKKQGSYYTPQVIVRYLVDQTLGRYLYGTTTGQPDGAPLPDEPRKSATDIRTLRVIDPACGSGSFLIYAYAVLADFYRREIERLEGERTAKLQALMVAGVTTPFELELELAPWTAELNRLRTYPRLILEQHLYGVDLDPQAAEIATVNLMMRAMADQPASERRLPLILSQNVKVGNSLIGAGPTDARYAAHAADLAALRRLRHQLISEAESGHAATLFAIAEHLGRVNQTLDERLASCLPNATVHRPFNWLAEFPEVFVDAEGARHAEAGFQVVLGNPPWEIIKPDLREYYAQFDARIESKLTRSQAEARIAELQADPVIVAGWQSQVARITAEAAYFSTGGDYTRQGKGDRATHKLFVERGYALLAAQGRLGLVIPSGIYTDLGTKPLRELLLHEGRIEFLFNFSNERFFFPDVHHSFKFTLLGAQKGVFSDGFWASFRFNPRVAVRPEELPEFLAKAENLVYIHVESLKKLNPENLTILEFTSQTDYALVERIYADHPTLTQWIDGSWNVSFTREFDKTNDRELFNESGLGLPVFQGANCGFYGEMLTPPDIWIEERLGREKLLRPLRKVAPNVPDDQIPLDYEHFRFGFRRIASSTNSRTLYVSYLPQRVFSMYTLTTTVQFYFSGTHFVRYMEKAEELFLYSCMASFVLDYIIRFQVASSVAMFNVYSLPVPRLTAGNPHFDAIVPRAARLTCTRAEFADLWQTVMGSAWTPASGVIDPVARQQVRDELDAIIAHLYGLSRGEFAHILSTFPLVFPSDAAGAAKKAAFLAVYDRFA